MKHWRLLIPLLLTLRTKRRRNVAEPVRDSIKRAIGQVRGDPESNEPDEADEDDEADGDKVGLVENPDDVQFQCATCDWFDDGICDNPHPKLKGQEVEGRWCCNEYRHPGMQTKVE